MRKTLLSLFLICLFHFTKAQQKYPSLDFKPQSPATAAFTRYGDVPVDLSTGVPDISIPIYTLSGHGINVPVSISYHASGIKVQDVASVVGLGWTLNAGGVITRSVLGQPDEFLDPNSAGQVNNQRPPWKNTDQFMAAVVAADSQNPDQFYWSLYENYLTKSHIDFHSDRYYYSLGNGESGVFRRDFINDGYKFIPYRQNKVRFYWAGSYLMAEIITSDGTQYTFKRNIYDLWYPEKIVNSSNTDSIMFYTRYERYSLVLFNQEAEFGLYKNSLLPRTEPWILEHPESACWNMLQLQERNVNYIANQPYNSNDEVIIIDSIVGTNASIQFTYAKDRQDLYIPNPGGNLSRLTKVQVYSRPTGAMVKEVNFSHSYSWDTSDPLTKRLMLDAVQTGVNGEEKHSFTYNPDWMPHYLDGNTPPTYQEDFWGYKNNGGAFTSIYDDFAPNGTPDRFPDDEKAQACILKEIKYPTGGKTVFEYECNRVDAGFYGFGFTRRPVGGRVGGLRVKKISNFAYEGATPQVKTYEYLCNLDPGVYGSLQFSNFVYTQETLNYYMVSGCNWETWQRF
jgi:hypothetical protein